jgi:hypothetical protein
VDLAGHERVERDRLVDRGIERERVDAHHAVPSRQARALAAPAGPARGGPGLADRPGWRRAGGLSPPECHAGSSTVR